MLFDVVGFFGMSMEIVHLCLPKVNPDHQDHYAVKSINRNYALKGNNSARFVSLLYLVLHLREKLPRVGITNILQPDQAGD